MPAKTRSRYVCQECGKQSLRHMGRCPACGEFNTMVEEVFEVSRPGTGTMQPRVVLPNSKPQRLNEVNTEEGQRLRVPMGEFNRVLGGGLVPGSIILIGGEPGIGKCVAEGTLIPTRRGLIPIEQLMPADAGDGFTEMVTELQSLDGVRPSSHFYDSGIQPTKRFATRMGFALQATYVHPVLTLSPAGEKTWKRVDELQPGDFVAVQRHGAIWGESTTLPDFNCEVRTNATVPRFPAELDEETAYCLGLLVGDGGLTDVAQVTLTTADAEIAAAYEAWVNRLGLKVNRVKTAKYRYSVSSRIFRRWLEFIGVSCKRAEYKAVPDVILRAPEPIVRAFLQGLFDTDGSSNTNPQGALPGAVEYCSVSEALARQVHLLLLQFGIVGKLRFKRTAGLGAWVLQLLGRNARHFYDRVGFRLPRKQASRGLLPEHSNHNLDVISFLPKLDPFRIPHEQRADRRYLKGSRAASYTKLAAIAEYVPELTPLPSPEFFWDEVVDVRESGNVRCYDLCVPETHAFVTNGIVSHNSTLLLQTSALVAESAGRVLYCSAEESTRQIKMRGDRLQLKTDNLYLVTETNLKNILEHTYNLDPTVLVVDSIQTIYTEESESSPGSVSQVRECASRLQMLAKTSGICVFLVGHVTKEGNIAGPRVLEHLVDTVLYLEGDPFQAYRLLRSVKNRFGATSEIGVFEMSGLGMIEVPNPSEAFLAERVVSAPGTAIAVMMEGTRPLLVEIQALTSQTTFGNPRRTPNGVDYNRLLLISAVLSKRLGLKLHEQDIFINVVGGLTVSEPASDLAMAVALASSYHNQTVPADMAFVGEIGLSGELRTVSQLPARLAEAAKLGFKRVMIPRLRRKIADVPQGLQLVEARNIGEALVIAVPKD